MKIYRQVPVTERLPEKEGYYITEEGSSKFKDGIWLFESLVDI